jgi:cytidyltransferase-like protein
MIISTEHLPKIREAHEDETLVFTHGVYDVFHYGHLVGLNWAKEHGDELVVGVSTDERVKRRKGPSRPIINQAARLAIVDALEMVDYSFLTEGEYDPRLPASLLAAKILCPDVVVLSDDCTANEESTWKQELSDTPARFVKQPADLRFVSTSEIIQRIKES